MASVFEADLANLKSSFKGDIILPSDESYIPSLKRWAASATRPARIVTFPSSNEDISASIKFASKHNLQVAIKGGGHGMGGSSSIRDGLVVDLGKVRYVRVDEKTKTAIVGGGTLWGEVDVEAIKFGLAAVAGTIDQVGVGGFTLGGGYGWLTGEHGLALDNLLSATLITPSGDILNVSPTSHEDLFWAIRGAGCNFGVVSEFVFQLHPQARTAFAGPLIFLPHQLESVIEALNKWIEKAGPKEAATFVFTRTPDYKPCVVFNPFFNGSEQEAKDIFKSFYAIGPVHDETSTRPYENINTLTNKFAPPHRNSRVFGAVTTKLTVETAKKAFDLYVKLTDPEFIKALPGAPQDLMGFKGNLIIEYFPAQKIMSTPTSATSFACRGPQFNALLTWSWTPSEESVAKGEAQDVEWIAPHLKVLSDIYTGAEGSIPNDENIGYPNYNEQQPCTSESLKRVFGSNYPRLQQLKKQYDPQGLFRQWWPIEPAA